MIPVVFEWVEYIVTKGENGYQHFSFFPECFQSTTPPPRRTDKYGDRLKDGQEGQAHTSILPENVLYSKTALSTDRLSDDKILD